MDRRIYGLETEYGITYLRGHRRLTPDEVARYLFRDAWRGGVRQMRSCRMVGGCISMLVPIPNMQRLNVILSSKR